VVGRSGHPGTHGLYSQKLERAMCLARKDVPTRPNGARHIRWRSGLGGTNATGWICRGLPTLQRDDILAPGSDWLQESTRTSGHIRRSRFSPAHGGKRASNIGQAFLQIHHLSQPSSSTEQPRSLIRESCWPREITVPHTSWVDRGRPRQIARLAADLNTNGTDEFPARRDITGPSTRNSTCLDRRRLCPRAASRTTSTES
jgi:hypothetical protein